jgi:hypothetical protein
MLWPHEIQGKHKRMGQFQKLTQNLFLTLHGRNLHLQQCNCPSFSCATSSSKPCMKLTPHCNHISGHFKMEHTESLFLLRRHLGNWPRGPVESIRSELLVAHEKLGQLPLLTVCVVPVKKVRNKFLVNFWNCTIFCVHPVFNIICPREQIFIWYLHKLFKQQVVSSHTK